MSISLLDVSHGMLRWRCLKNEKSAPDVSITKGSGSGRRWGRIRSARQIEMKPETKAETGLLGCNIWPNCK